MVKQLVYTVEGPNLHEQREPNQVDLEAVEAQADIIAIVTEFHEAVTYLEQGISKEARLLHDVIYEDPATSALILMLAREAKNDGKLLRWSQLLLLAKLKAMKSRATSSPAVFDEFSLDGPYGISLANHVHTLDAYADSSVTGKPLGPEFQVGELLLAMDLDESDLAKVAKVDLGLPIELMKKREDLDVNRIILPEFDNARIDGENMHPEIRARIEEYLKSKGMLPEA